MSFSGFDTKDQESKYNLTVFDLIMTLSARVNASLNCSKIHHFVNLPTYAQKPHANTKRMKLRSKFAPN